MTSLYCIFHLNLMFSSLEKKDRARVIERCYWPLLKLIENQRIPAGIEMPALTLQEIARHDRAWVRRLQILIRQELVELIGSGYAQLIGPLAPARLNEKNQALGIELYRKYLGVRPAIALVNEMAYSQGLISHYRRSGYRAIVMEWNNPRSFHPEWKADWQYYPQRAVNDAGEKIPVIWSNSVAFQKFQRYAHGEITFDDYLEYLRSHQTSAGRFFCLYANDAEIFDFRPGRYRQEARLQKHCEWNRIEELFYTLSKSPGFQFVLPRQVLSGLSAREGGRLLRLDSSAHPIPVKKQEKYNIIRWAVTGRGDLRANSGCHQIYRSLLPQRGTRERDWKDLCYLWSSDFRTHITRRRWQEFQTTLQKMQRRWQPAPSHPKPPNGGRPPAKKRNWKITEKGKLLVFENRQMRCLFDRQKGFTVSQLVFKSLSPKPVLGTLPHGYYQDVSLGADFFSGHLTVQEPGKHKFTDLGGPAAYALDFPDSRSVVIRRRIPLPKGWIASETELRGGTVEFRKKLVLPRRALGVIRPFHFTFFPDAWSSQSLYYATHNGSKHLEAYRLSRHLVDHGEPLSPLISSKTGLGATEGRVVIGDAKKTLVFEHDTGLSALMPSITARASRLDKLFLRLVYSAQEMDETFVRDASREEISCRLKLWGEKRGR